jgi:hypothetical protein
VLVAWKKEPANAPVLGPRFTIVDCEEALPNLRDIVGGHDCGVGGGRLRDFLCSNDVASSPPESKPNQEQEEDENRDTAEERWNTS